MTLRNAFANLLTESFAGAVEQALTRMDQRDARRNIMEIPRDLQYARDSQDQMRVTVASGSVTTSAVNLWSYGSYANWYGSGGPNSIDARQQQAELSMQTFNNVRTNRWRIT